MKNGIFQQIGTPSEIYDRPKNAYVAHFVGSANILSGTAVVKNGSVFLQYGGGLAEVLPEAREIEDGAPLTAAVRSEVIDLLPTGEAGIPALVKEKSFAVAPGDSVVIRFSPEAAAIVEAEDEKP